MNYPNGPYGQGYPGQPGYPQQQPNYQQQGYPQQPGYPGAYQYQPMQPASPGGGTAITAIVLAGLGTLANLGGGLLGLIGLIALSNDSAFESVSDVSGGVFAVLILGVFASIVAGLLLLGGTITLMQRKMIGRWLVVSGCAITMLGSLLNLGLSAAVMARYETYGGGNGYAVLGLIFPIATLVLVLLPSTTAWIQAKRNPIAPQYYPPYQS